VLPPAAASGWQAIAADIAAPDDEHEAPARVTPERVLDFGTGSAT
jgi:hypothetical protein